MLKYKIDRSYINLRLFWVSFPLKREKNKTQTKCAKFYLSTDMYAK